MAKSSEDAYRAIHEGLYYAVESMLEDCNYEEAIKYADMMEELERDKVSIIETYDMEGNALREYYNG